MPGAGARPQRDPIVPQCLAQAAAQGDGLRQGHGGGAGDALEGAESAASGEQGRQEDRLRHGD